MFSQYIAFVNIGFGHAVCINKVKCLTLPKTAPGIRLQRIAKKDGRFIDGTCGKPMKTLIVMDDNTIIASAFTPATLIVRFRKACFDFINDTDPKKGSREWLENYKAQLLLARKPDNPEEDADATDEEIVETDGSEILDYEQNMEPFREEDYNPPPDPEDDEIPDEYEEGEEEAPSDR